MGYRMKGFSGFGDSPVKQKKKVAKQILKKVGGRLLGPVGVALNTLDIPAVAGHIYKTGSLKKGIVNWLGDDGKGPGGMIPSNPWREGEVYDKKGKKIKKKGK